MRQSHMLVALAALGCAGGAGSGGGGGGGGAQSATPQPDPAAAVLRNGAGQEVGRVSLREAGDRIAVRVRVNRGGIPAGDHGMHLHEIGRCQPPGFESAGPHLNPGGARKHGHRNPDGPHLGDLGNLTVDSDGRGERTVELSGPEAAAGLPRLLGGLGRSLVVHAGPDDERTDPSGNSGARIACAELR